MVVSVTKLKDSELCFRFAEVLCVLSGVCLHVDHAHVSDLDIVSYRNMYFVVGASLPVKLSEIL